MSKHNAYSDRVFVSSGDAPQPSRRGRRAKWRPHDVTISIAPHEHVDIQFATHVVVNIAGPEFIISFLQARVPVFRDPSELPNDIQAKVLFRASMSPARWAETVNSMAQQVQRLQDDGVLSRLDESEGDSL